MIQLIRRAARPWLIAAGSVIGLAGCAAPYDAGYAPAGYPPAGYAQPGYGAPAYVSPDYGGGYAPPPPLFGGGVIIEEQRFRRPDRDRERFERERFERERMRREGGDRRPVDLARERHEQGPRPPFQQYPPGRRPEPPAPEQPSSRQ